MPSIGMEANQPPNLHYVRDLEYLEGTLLAELSDGTNHYLEKWCDLDREKRIHRFLVIRSDEKSISEYLDEKLSMWDLFTKRSSNIGWLFDYGDNEEVTVVEVTSLPKEYLPSMDALHDPSLRPDYFKERQNNEINS